MLDAAELWQLIELRAAATPDAELLVDDRGHRMTFGQYRTAAERAAAGLFAQGITAGSVVAWQLPTWIESAVLVGALSRLGAVQVPVLPIHRDAELAFAVAQTDARTLITAPHWRGYDYPSLARRVAQGRPGLRVIVVRGRPGDPALPDADPSGLPAPAADPTAPVRWVFYTSGTTSEPKGALHTDHSVLAGARGLALRQRCTDQDRTALVFPFAHIGGCTTLFIAALMSGGALIMVEAFDGSALDLLERERVTLAGAGPVFHRAYLAAQRSRSGGPLLRQVRAFPSGGAPRPPAMHGHLKAAFGGAGVAPSYGLTEAPILTCADADDSDEVLATTEGRPVPGVELDVVSEAGVVLGPGQEGEIRVRAPQLMRGYADPALDSEAFDAEGRFRTGDLGRTDQAGNLTLTGRIKDIIIRKGENISPRELEDHLHQHPDVGEAVVLGLPDDAAGEIVCAVVRPNADRPAPTLSELCAFLLKRGLSTRKLPEQLRIVADLPRNSAGKVIKSELRRLAARAGDSR